MVRLIKYGFKDMLFFASVRLKRGTKKGTTRF